MSLNKELQETVTQLISDHLIEGYFLSRLSMKIVKKIDGPINTACMGYANGSFYIHFSGDFWKKLTNNERIAVLRHEVHHFLNRHLTRAGDRDSFVYNLAADMAINQFLKDLPKGAVEVPQNWEKNQSAEFYYEKLFQEVKNQGKCPSCNNGNCEKCGGSGKRGGGKCSNCKGTGKCSKCGGTGKNPGHGKSFDDLKPGKTDLENGEADVQAKTMIQDIVKELIESGTKDRHELRGFGGGILEEALKDFNKKPMVHWKTVLSRFVSSFTMYDSTRTLNRPDRRELVPWGHKKERRPKLIVAIDTSGSVSNKMLVDFFSQVRILGMMLSEIKVIACDAHVTLDVIYRPGLENKLKAVGRGGTDFEPVVELVNKKYANFDGMVYLTDGHCPLPSMRCKVPTMWIVDGNDDFPGFPKVNVPKENSNDE